jgi:hypothetical protein
LCSYPKEIESRRKLLLVFQKSKVKMEQKLNVESSQKSRANISRIKGESGTRSPGLRFRDMCVPTKFVFCFGGFEMTYPLGFTCVSPPNLNFFLGLSSDLPPYFQGF